jgi:hypothetical protein
LTLKREKTSLAAAPAGPAPASLVPAVGRALLLLERLARERRPLSATQLAAELALPRARSTACATRCCTTATFAGRPTAAS